MGNCKISIKSYGLLTEDIDRSLLGYQEIRNQDLLRELFHSIHSKGAFQRTLPVYDLHCSGWLWYNRA